MGFREALERLHMSAVRMLNCSLRQEAKYPVERPLETEHFFRGEAGPAGRYGNEKSLHGDSRV